jgi:hypothetical protein
MSHKRHQPPSPPEDDRQLWRAIAGAIAQGLSRETLWIIFWEVSRHF